MSKNKNISVRLLRLTIVVLLFALVTYLIPHYWCAREAPQIFSNSGNIQEKIAKQVESIISHEMDRKSFKTGSELFNGEWLFGSYMMSGMGFGQMSILNPGQKERYLTQMEKCIRQMLSPDVREFDKNSWENDPIDSLDSDSDHAAYLGYFNLLLSFHRLLKNKSEFSGLNDRITSALARRLEKSRTLLLQTYPGEYYPVDNCAVIASIGLYDRATGANHSDLTGKCLSRMKTKYTDEKTGILFQCVDGETGIPADLPRGSGTSLGLYFLSFIDPDLSLSLYNSLKRELRSGLFGFGGIKEYPSSVKGGYGDIDSGPVIFGYGFSASGFTVAGTRIHGDYDLFRKLYATVYLFGAPYDSNGKRNFVIGGPIGNSIMFAMLTALDKNQFKKYCRSNGK